MCLYHVKVTVKAQILGSSHELITPCRAPTLSLGQAQLVLAQRVSPSPPPKQRMPPTTQNTKFTNYLRIIQKHDDPRTCF